MARREVTGRRPRATAVRSKRKPGPPQLTDPDAIEPMPYSGESSVAARTKAAPIRGPPTPTAVYSIASFAAAFGISESMYFKLRAEGRGPREMRLGSRVFITFEAAERWRIEREAATVATE
jgi:hypothetical protein